MSKKKKGIIAFLLSMMLMLYSLIVNMNTVIAREGELSGEIEVIFNRNQAEMQVYMDRFEKLYPGTTVHYTSYNDYENSIKERIDSGNYGDVIFFPGYMGSEDADKYFEPLGKYEVLNEKYNYLNQGRSQSEIVYGIPSCANMVGAIYNKKVFDKAGISKLPTSIEEFLDAMYLIKENTDAIPFYTGYEEPWVLGYWENFPYVEMTGKATYKYYDFLLDRNPFREGTVHNQTMNLLYELVKRGYTEFGNTKMTWWDSVVKLNSGEIACSFMGTWSFKNYKAVGENADDIGFMPFPNTIDGKQYVTVVADYSYAIAKNSENKELAKAFLEFMLDESGYAIDRETLSVLKTDPMPETYGNIKDVVIMSSYSKDGNAYELYNKLSANLNFYAYDEYKRIIEAAAGVRNESFQDIMDDWNRRWEAGRAGQEIQIEDDINKDEQIEDEEEKIAFSQKELEYIEDNSKLTVGYHKNLAPLSFERNGKFTGLAADVCDMISKKTGIQMVYVGYENTKDMVKALGRGEIDFIAGIEKTGTYSYLNYSKEYLKYMNVLVRHNTLNVNSLKVIAEVTGETIRYSNKEEIKRYGSIEESIERVNNLTADFTITNYYTSNYYIRKNQFDELTVIPNSNDNTFHIAFSEDVNPMLIAIANKCIYNLETGEMEIRLMGYMDSVVSDITMGTFLKANPIIVAVFLVFVVAVMMIFIVQKIITTRKRVLDAKKYELLAGLADEYIFEYSYSKDRYKFDKKFREEIDFAKEVDRKGYSGSSRYLSQFIEQMEGVIEGREDTQSAIFLETETGKKQWYRVITSVLKNEIGHPIHVLGKLVNIQKEMDELEEYQNKAHRDPLTTLYNREGFFAHMPKVCEKVLFAVMDVDDFKMVNDTLGHNGGDEVLKKFADNLKEYMGNKAIIARYGGDEFIVMIPNISTYEAEKRLGELVKSMNHEFSFEGNKRCISISVGAIYSESTRTYEDMFRRADKVLYMTKETGKNGFKMEII